MRDRIKPFPIVPVIMCSLLVVFGIVSPMLGYAHWPSGVFGGFGLGMLLCVIMVWASPLNEARK